MTRSKKTQGDRGATGGESTGCSTQSATKAPSSKRAADGEVTVDRRTAKDRRTGEDRRKKREPIAVQRRKIERRAKVPRRRQIDPTTCERDYTADEIEFMNALDEYKRTSGRMFPTCSEILEVVRNLGYQKCLASDLPDRPQRPAQAAPAEGGPGTDPPLVGPVTGEAIPPERRSEPAI